MESIEPWINPAILIGGILFLGYQLVELRRDVADLRERMAKLEGLFERMARIEGLFEGFTRGEVRREQPGAD